MADVSSIGERIEERKDLGTGDDALYAYWMAQEAVAEKEERKWIKRSREIVKRYRDERPESIQSTHRFNILWSNVQTLIPTLYARTPKADVDRRFKDADPNGRYASILLERCCAYSIDAFDFDAVMRSVVEDRLLPGRGVARVLYVPHFGEPIQEVGENAEFEEQEASDATVDSPGDEKKDPLREVVYEEVVAKYVFWEDYREGPARQWDEVPWVRYRSYLTRDGLTKRFGKKGKDVNLDYAPKGMGESVKSDPPPDLYKKAQIHEYWDKAKKQVIWLAPGTPDVILDKQEDPLELPDFFPNPDPMLATTSNDKRIPVPDYVEYQDQARELDAITQRIDRLTRALKVSGVYAAEYKQELQQLLDEGTENRLIPVGDVQNWTDKGGMKGIIEWMPIQQVAETLIQLYNARDRVKSLLYEITGIGDILRGETNPNETATAQQLKANFSTRRITPQQQHVAKFARNLVRLMAGIIATHFSPKTISMITGFPVLQPVPQLPPPPQPPQMLLAPQVPPGLGVGPMGGAPPPGLGAPPPSPNGAMAAPPGQPGAPQGPPQPPPDPRMVAYQQQMAQWQQMAQKVQAIVQDNQKKQQEFDAACALIKSDGVHGFKIDIEVDSTIAPDEQAEKQSRVEFLQQMVPLLGQVVPLAMGNPALASVAREIALFAARGFRVARPLEETLEQAFDAIGKMPPHPSQQAKPGPDSPGDLAVRSKEVDTRAQIAQQKNVVDMAKIGMQERIEQEKLGAQQENERAHLALETARAADEKALRGARMTHIEARDASMLS